MRKVTKGKDTVDVTIHFLCMSSPKIGHKVLEQFYSLLRFNHSEHNIKKFLHRGLPDSSWLEPYAYISKRNILISYYNDDDTRKINESP